MKRWIPIIVVFMLFGAGCKSSSTLDVSSSTAPTAAPAPTTADATDDSGDEGADTGTDDGSADAAPADAAPADSGDDTADLPDFLTSGDWCTAAQAVEDQFDELDFAGAPDPAQLEQAYRTVLAYLKAVQPEAPPQIAGDVATTVAAFETLVAELEKVDWSFLDLDLTVLDEIGPEIEQASFNIEKYNFEVCGIDNGFDPNDDPSLRPDTGDTGGSADTPQGSIRDTVIEGLVQSGFTAQEAACIVDGLDISDPNALADDPTALLGLFDQCGISLDRLGQLGG